MMVLFLTGSISSAAIDSDWLVTPIEEPVRIEERLDGKEVVLSNGLISRGYTTVRSTGMAQ